MRTSTLSHPVVSFLQFQHLLRWEVARSRRYRRPFSVLALQVEGVAEFEHTDGRRLRSQTLDRLLDVLLGETRDTDLVGVEGLRWYLLAPETREAEALRYAERLCTALRAAQHPELESRALVVSAGVTASPEAGELSVESITREAEEALACALAAGGDRVLCFSCTLDE